MAAPALRLGVVDAHPYLGMRAALLTQHEKERVVAPALHRALAIELEVVRDFDTDSLGTFTRDVPRAGTQLEAARTKAKLASERSGLALGLGSEGSFGPGPFGFGVWNVELVVLRDAARGIEIVGRAQAPGLHHHATVETLGALHAAAAKAGFPEHGLVLMADDEHDVRPQKGLRTREALEAAFAEARARSRHGAVWVENDLRAHQHPSRMTVIEAAVKDLVLRVEALCPACGAPGFGLARVVPGLRCGDCGAPTEVPVADELACVACPATERRPRPGPDHADPGRCPYCNP